MLRTVTKNTTIIITKYTWYHRYRVIIQMTGGPPLWLHRKPGSNAGRRKLQCSDAIFIPLQRFLLAQYDTVVCHSWSNFNKIIAFCSGTVLCSHLFTCFCTGSTDFRWNCCVQVTSAFRSFRSLSSFKMGRGVFESACLFLSSEAEWPKTRRIMCDSPKSHKL